MIAERADQFIGVQFVNSTFEDSQVIEVNDGLPHQICPKCLHLLKQALYFKLKCEQSHQRLKKLTKIKEKLQTNIVEFSMFLHYFPSYGMTKLKSPEIRSNTNDVNIPKKCVVVLTPLKNISQDNQFNKYKQELQYEKIDKDEDRGSNSEASEHNSDSTFRNDSDFHAKNMVQQNNKSNVFVSTDEDWLYKKMLAHYKKGQKYDTIQSHKSASKDKNNKHSKKLAIKTDEKCKRHKRINQLRRAIKEEQNRTLETDLLQGKFLIKKQQVLKEPASSTCKVCEKKFSSMSALKLHSQQHYGYRFICEHCGKSVATQTALASHLMNRHGLQKRHSCEKCDFKAVHRFEIKEHMRKHTGERPFTCDKCGLTFRRRAIWKKHQYKHGERTFKCAQCPRSFFLRSDLSEHTNNMHERRYLYRCVELGCGATYAKTSTVRRHLTSAHGVPRAQQGKILRVNVESEFGLRRNRATL